jgi:hypothetical protein
VSSRVHRASRPSRSRRQEGSRAGFARPLATFAWQPAACWNGADRTIAPIHSQPGILAPASRVRNLPHAFPRVRPGGRVVAGLAVATGAWAPHVLDRARVGHLGRRSPSSLALPDRLHKHAYVKSAFKKGHPSFRPSGEGIANIASRSPAAMEFSKRARRRHRRAFDCPAYGSSSPPPRGYRRRAGRCQ